MRRVVFLDHFDTGAAAFRYVDPMARFDVQQGSINLHPIVCVALRSASRLRARCAWGVYRTVRGKTQARVPATPGQFAGLL